VLALWSGLRLAGTFLIGMGEQFDEKELKPMH
jgi:hypothetical protein